MTQLTYKDAGVNIDEGEALVDDITAHVERTRRPEVIGGLGGFGALFAVPKGYDEPVLVSGTDGVGTKLKLAFTLEKYDTIGIDLVAMCVNDVLVQGAQPLFFLDYYATGKLERPVAREVIKGIAEGCYQAGCSLVGGETAEMPGMYSAGEFDLAGFCVGIAERSKLISGQKLQAGDVLIGLPSSGAHSNGYSLIRKIVDVSGAKLSDDLDDKTLGDVLLAPTRIYVKLVLDLLKQFDLPALAHITGGGLTENLPRVLPEGLGIHINPQSWPRPALFNWLQQHGNVPAEDMLRTFNCGIGFVLFVPAAQAEAVMSALATQGEAAYRIGEVVQGESVVSYL